MATEPYTPDTREIRDLWIYEWGDLGKAAEEFDRWILDVQAQAWEDGHGDARGFYAGGPKEPNPFRKGTK